MRALEDFGVPQLERVAAREEIDEAADAGARPQPRGQQDMAVAVPGNVLGCAEEALVAPDRPRALHARLVGVTIVDPAEMDAGIAVVIADQAAALGILGDAGRSPAGEPIAVDHRGIEAAVMHGAAIAGEDGGAEAGRQDDAAAGIDRLQRSPAEQVRQRHIPRPCWLARPSGIGSRIAGEVRQ